VLEREVDDAVRVGGAAAQPVEVVQIAAADLRAERGDGLRGGIGAGEADDLVAVGEKFRDDGGGDMA